MQTNETEKRTAQGSGDAGTALAIAPGSFTGRILQPADFTALDGLIKTLGDKSAHLSESEKSGAIAVIDEWNASVTSRIRANADMARMVLSFLDGAQLWGQSLEDAVELFHEAIGDTPEYLAYHAAVEAYAAVSADAPIDVPVSGGMTVEQSDRICLENHAAKLEHGRKLRSAEHGFNKAVKAYVKALNAMPEIKALRGSLTSYKNKASRMAADCADKATRAKLNVTVSDPDVRQALHDMMDFAKNV